MKRIYESDALDRDDDDPFSPSASAVDSTGRGYGLGGSMVDWGATSHALLPGVLRAWAIDVSVETDSPVYDRDRDVAIRVTMRNRLPFPIHLRTGGSLYWNWAVDGATAGSRLPADGPDGDSRLLSFDRSERKRFVRTWPQRFRTDEAEWTAAEPGSYEVEAWINVAAPVERGLHASASFEIE